MDPFARAGRRVGHLALHARRAGDAEGEISRRHPQPVGVPHLRVGTYTLADHTFEGVEDEGWVSMGLATPADGSSTDAKLQETLFNWWGWSLSARRPGKTMDKDGNPRVVIHTNHDGSPRLQLLGDERTVLFQAPPAPAPRR